MAPKPLSHWATQQFMVNLIYMYFCHGVAYEYFSTYKTWSCIVHVMGFWEGLKFEANVRHLNPSATQQFIGNVTYVYFCHEVAYEYFSTYGTRSRVGHMARFWGDPKFEANVCRLNPLATRPHVRKNNCTENHTLVNNNNAYQNIYLQYLFWTRYN